MHQRSVNFSAFGQVLREKKKITRKFDARHRTNCTERLIGTWGVAERYPAFDRRRVEGVRSVKAGKNIHRNTKLLINSVIYMPMLEDSTTVLLIEENRFETSLERLLLGQACEAARRGTSTSYRAAGDELRPSTASSVNTHPQIISTTSKPLTIKGACVLIHSHYCVHNRMRYLRLRP